MDLLIAEFAGEKDLVETEEVAEVTGRVIALIEESGSIPRALNSPSSSCSLKIDRLCSLLKLFNCSYGNTPG